MSITWSPSLGACLTPEGVRFRVWAPEARQVDVVLDRPGQEDFIFALDADTQGFHSGLHHAIKVGDHYRYRVDGAGPFPDPASRFQPFGVHGPSEIVDTRCFPWTDEAWTGIPLQDAIIYELHVGTFTHEGTFQGVRSKLPYLAELGVTILELMPVADFPGQRNWGYDGVDLYAPARCYGRPEDLQGLVNEAHRHGLAVILDVVYNHLGPEGNYLRSFSPYYFSNQRKTPWGDGLSFAGEHASPIRDFFIENAVYWLHEFHLDGLRFDATHAIPDDGPRPFLAEIRDRVRAIDWNRSVLLIAEDHRNLAHIVKPTNEQGWGFDAVWADDFHHQVHRILAGDHEGYYGDYSDQLADLAETIRQGWLFQGQYSTYYKEPRGTDPSGIPHERFVYCMQNHDHVGNRAFGERLHHQIDLAAYRAATVLLLLLPQTPLMFMGQEWACSSPFRYFTDHHDPLGKQVAQGRRQEFKDFVAFAMPQCQESIPDPQARATFLSSCLNWQEMHDEPHAKTIQLFRTLLHLRRIFLGSQSTQTVQFRVEIIDVDTLMLIRHDEKGTIFLVVIRLRGKGMVDLQGHACPKLIQDEKDSSRNRRHSVWDIVMTSEDSRFCTQPQLPRIDFAVHGPIIHFEVPSAVILRSTIRSSNR